MFLRGYGHYVRTAASLQWDEAAVDLRADAIAWQRIPPARREPLLTLLAGFCLGEARVAAELEPFARACGDPVAAACFRAQEVDEARHARFFERVVAEVALPHVAASEREAVLRTRLAPAFIELFEGRLSEAVRDLAGGEDALAPAVALYHMILEGAVFTAGQLALLDLLEADRTLPGMRRGLDLVVRDERWHVGFGARALALLGGSPAMRESLAAAAEPAVAAWGDAVPPKVQTRVVALHHRRLHAARLTPQEVLS